MTYIYIHDIYICHNYYLLYKHKVMHKQLFTWPDALLALKQWKRAR